MELHERLRNVRLHRGLKLQEVAELTTLSASYISDVERGRVNPSFKNLERLAQAYQLTVSELLVGVGRPSTISIDGLAPGLATLVKKGWIAEDTAQDLNRIALSGRQPETEEAWFGLYLYLKQVAKTPEIKTLEGDMPESWEQEEMAGKGSDTETARQGM